MKIVVDTREKKGVLRILKQLGIPYTRGTLVAGDYETDNCCAERKTVKDLVGSIKGTGKGRSRKEGRLFKQMEKLADKCDETKQIPFLFVSGNIKETCEWYETRGIKVNINSLFGALASVIVRYGVHIFANFSDDKEMFYCMNSVFEKVRDGKYLMPHREQLKRNKNKKVALWCTILRSRPKIIKQLIKKYESLEEFLKILRTQPSKLELIAGIGKGTVAKWKRLLE